MHYFVGGSLGDVPRDAELCRMFVGALGAEIVRQGHVLLTGCRSSLDMEVARAAQDWLSSNQKNPEEQIVSYCLRSAEPAHAYGKVRSSALVDWQMNHPELEVPEQIRFAGVTIFIAGNQGTFWAKNWAYFARKPILGVPRFGGAGETIYLQELKRLREHSPTVADEYEALNQLSSDFSRIATEVVDLGERLVRPRSVFTIMSFKQEFREVFASFTDVCAEFGFNAQRTDQSTSLERIIPRIETGIRMSAFVIADVSEWSPNVFYEVGFARALAKDVIVTARKGTRLPFNVGDIPTLFWNDPDDLREGLRKRIAGLLLTYGPLD